VVLAVQGVLLLLVVLRLWNLQISCGEEYEAMARENRVRIRVTRPIRGRILDRSGRILAEDRPQWNVRLGLGRMLPPDRAAAIMAAEKGEPYLKVRRELGRGWGRHRAQECRTLRYQVLLKTLARLAGILSTNQEDLVLNLRKIEEGILEEEARERVRVLGLALGRDAEDRARVRKELRRRERALGRELLDFMPQDAFLLVAGFRWDILDRASEVRLGWVLALARERELDAAVLRKKFKEVARATERHALRAVAGRDHVLYEGFLDYQTVLRLELACEDMPGMSVDARPARIYPHGECVCHLLGYVGYLGWGRRGGEDVNFYEEKEGEGCFFRRVSDFLNREEYEEIESSGEFLRDLYGRGGVEAMLDEELRGRRGARVVECDRRRQVQRNLAVHPSVNGRTVILTVDVVLQERAAAAFRPEHCRKLNSEFEMRGAAVFLDVETGAVRAMVSVPGFDLNHLLPPVQPGRAQALFSHKGRPLFNRALAGCYPPGSTFKALTSLAAWTEGVLTTDTVITCRGALKKYNHVFHCNSRYGHGDMDLGHALMQSCNVFFYVLGDRLGSRLGAHAEMLGFGLPTGIGLPGEKAGVVPYSMMPGHWIQLAIGQGLTVTPLQMARFMAFIATGRFVAPHVLGPPPPYGEVNVNGEALEAVREGMRRVVHDSRGTARLPLLRRLGAAGKTGTAETGRRKDGVPLNHAWFAGYAPFDHPTLAFAVVVEDVPHGVHGGDIAAPIAAEILAAALGKGGGR
jgi:penicillin-binding protein 2